MSKASEVMERLLQGEQVEWKSIEEIALEITSGGTPKTSEQAYYNGNIPWLRTQEVGFNDVWDTDVKITELGLNKSSAKIIPANSVIVAMYGATVGRVAINKIPLATNQACANIVVDKSKANYRYVFYYLSAQYKYIKSLGVGSQTNINMGIVRKLTIPIPPLHVQEEIVRILDTFTELIKELTKEQQARQTQYEYYRDKLLTFEEGEVEWVKLGEVTRYEQPNKYIVNSREFCDIPNHTSNIPVLTAGKTFILGYTCESEGIYKAAEKPVIIFDDFTTDTRWIDFDFKIRSSTLKMITSTDETFALQKFIFYWLEIQSSPEKGSNRRQWISNYVNKKIPIPPLHIQQEIVDKLDRFNALANSITEGLPREIELRQKQYEYYRDLLLSFPKAA